MSIDELLTRLAARDIRLQRHGDGLRCVAPQGALDESLSAAIKVHKAQLLVLLQQSSEPDSSLTETAPIPIAPRDQPIPLSHVQERMWFWDRMAGPNCVYNIAVPLLLLDQGFDPGALQYACDALVRRHAILRTVFRSRGSDTEQVILEHVEVLPQVIALSRDFGPHETARDAELRDILQRQARTPFDLTSGPLFRMVVVRLHERSHVLLVMLHHIISDGWSNQVLVRELTTLYNARSRGVEMNLPRVSAQYADYTVWQRRNLQQGRRFSRQLDYWVEKLRGLPPLLELPYDKPRPAAASYEGDTLSFQLEAELSSALRQLAHEHRASLFMLLLAVFQLMISRFSGRSDVVVGSPLTNRRHPQLEEMIGPCLNTMALRARVDEQRDFVSYLLEVRRTVLEAFDNQDLPFEQVVNALRVQRTLAYEPLVQVGFLLKAPALGEVRGRSGRTMEECFGFDMRSITGYSKLDLTVMTKEEGERIVGWLEYSTDLFERPTIERMIECFRTLLADVVKKVAADARCRIEQIAGTDLGGRTIERAEPPSQATVQVRPPYVAPRTEVERQVIESWIPLLEAEAIGALDNFFALGGDSLRVMHVTAQLRETCAVDLPLKALFEYQTVECLASYIETLRAADSGPASDAAEPASLAPQPRVGAVPLSYGQEGLWILDQMGSLGAAYNIGAALELEGELDESGLQWALGEIVRRHESLRTRFEQVDGRAVQVIDAARGYELGRLDGSQWVGLQQAQEVQRVIQQELKRPFDLARGPLFRSALVKLGPRSRVLALTMSHIVADGWSVGVFIRELSQLYEAYTQGRGSPLQELDLQYADYAIWQRQRLQGEGLERQMSYWREALAGAPLSLELPTDRVRPAVLSHRGAIHRFALPVELSAQLKGMARQERATLFMVLLSGFGILLSKLSGQSEVVIGTPVAGRVERRLEALIGYFVNTLALRLEVSQGERFEEYLQRVRQAVLQAYAHQEAPFEKVVQELQPQRSLSRHALFQVMFVLEHDGAQGLQLPGLTLRPLRAQHVTSKFDLTLSVRETPAQLQCAFEYATDLFDHHTIERFAAYFITLLEQLVANPCCALGGLSLLRARDQRALVTLGNEFVSHAAEEGCVHELIARWAERTPDAIAVTCASASLTYAELDIRANQMAHHLRALGVGPDVLVALCVGRSPQMIVAILAILKTGGAYVPLDPSYPKERLTFVLNDTAAQVLVTERTLSDVVPHPAHTVYVDDDFSAPAAHASNPVPAAQPQNLIYCIYTSGSTGSPKGTLLTHEHVLRLFAAAGKWLSFDRRDVWTLFHSYAFDFSVWEIFGALLHGGRLVIVPFVVSRSPAEFLKLLAHERVTVLNQTPSAFRQLVPLATASHTRQAPALRYVIFGGEALNASILAPWFDTYGEDMPAMINMYGITETTVHVTFRRMRAADAATATASRIGVPLDDLQVHILDGCLSPVPIGVNGEICVAGAGLARGYLNRPALTALRFVPNPFAATPGGRLYRSADLGRRRHDGEIVFLGRQDHQVKLRGHRIELGEIEAVLRSHAEVADAVVLLVGVDDDTARLVAWLVAADGATLDCGALRRSVSDQLPSFMVPTELVVIEALPLTANGKLEVGKLPVPRVSKRDLLTECVAPTNAREQLLADIWREVLRLESVGIHDNFFSLGGDSMRALQVVRLGQRKGLALTIQRLYEHQSIAALAGVMCAAAGTPSNRGAPPIELIGLPEHEVRELADVEEAYPVSTMQQMMLSEYAKDSRREGVYHVQQSFRLRDPQPSADAMQRALQALISAHPVLRTAFVRTASGAPAQVIRRQVPVTLTRHDISHQPPSQQDAYIAAQALSDRMTAFVTDRLAAPLFRFHWFRTGAQEFELFMSIHHAIDDGWGNQHFLAQLLDLYERAKRGEGIELPARKNVFREFVSIEHAVRGSDHAAAFWRQRPLSVTDTRCLERPPVQQDGALRHSFTVDKRTVESLIAVGRDLGVSLKAVLLCAFLDLIEGETGRALPTVGVVSNGRTAQLSDPLHALGLFWNLVPFGLAKAGTVRAQRLRLAQQELLEIERYASYPLTQIAHDRGAGELFFATFNFVNFHNAAAPPPLSSMQCVAASGIDRFHFPLNHRFAVRRERGEIAVVTEYNGRWFSDDHVRIMNATLSKLLAHYAAAP